MDLQLEIEGGAPAQDTPDIFGGRILIVDDERQILDMLVRVLTGAGFTNIRTISDSSEVLSEVRGARPDVLLLDLHMPEPDGFQILETLEAEGANRDFLPVLVLTGDHSLDAKRRAIPGFARELLTKPFDPREVVLRVENMLRVRLQQQLLLDERATMAEKLASLQREVQLARLEAVQKLRAVADRPGPAVAHHNTRVAELAELIAQGLDLPKHVSYTIGKAALLHDLGKAVLDPDRPELHHSVRGAELIGDARSPLLRIAAEIARHHHERWDGSGQPAAAKGDAIPIAARIVAVADHFDHLTHPLDGVAPCTREEALAHIQERAGSWYDRTVVAALADIVPDLQADLAGSYLRRPD